MSHHQAPPNRRTGNRLAWALRAVLAAVLVLSGVGKLLDPSAAIKVFELVTDYRPDLANGAQSFVWVLSIFEVALAAWLIVSRRSWALGALFGLVSLFTLVLVSLPMRGIDVPECGCFGALVPGGSLPTVMARNVGLLALTAAAFVLGQDMSKSRPEQTPSSVPVHD